MCLGMPWSLSCFRLQFLANRLQKGATMELRDRVWARIDALDGELWSLALRIHDHPEVAFEELEAMEWLSQSLEEHGFNVQRGAGNLPSAFRADHPAVSEGPALAILAEYDALPGIGHACGHNIIATIAIGAALGLAAVKDQLPGRLVVAGTPAEEGGGGKVILVRNGVFEDVDAAMMIHPSSHTTIAQAALARIKVEVSFTGMAAHASAEPERGINALDAVIQTFNGLNALRQHIRDGARIHGVITDGGERPNIVPEHASALFYVRASDNAYCEELVGKLHRCAQGAALATGATLDFKRVGEDYKTILNNRRMGQVFEKHITALGYPPGAHEGGIGSTDMGNVSWEVPSIHPYLQIADPTVAAHSREFAAASRSDRARVGMLAGAKAIAATCLDLWLEKGLYEDVRAEFEQRNQ